MNKWGVVAKAERVVESCVTIEQLNVARNYYRQASRIVIKDIKRSYESGALHHNYDWDVLYTGLTLIECKQTLLNHKGGIE